MFKLLEMKETTIKIEDGLLVIRQSYGQSIAVPLWAVPQFVDAIKAETEIPDDFITPFVDDEEDD